MRHRLLTLTTTLLCLASVAVAQTNIGYTNEECPRTNNFRLGSAKPQGLAIRLSHEKLQSLRGRTIGKVRTVFGSKNATGGQANLFITKTLGGDALTSQTVSITSSNQWIEFPLDKGYTITGDEEELYIGFTLEISAAYGPFSSDGTTDSQGLCFAYGSNGWQDLYGKGYGMANIEVVLNEALNATDLMLKTCTAGGYLKAETAYDYALEVFNMGTTTVGSFTVETLRNGQLEGSQTFENVALSPKGNYSLIIKNLAINERGNCDLAFRIKDIKDASGTTLTDADTNDNTTSKILYFYPKDMERNVLVESFTAQSCTNCASGHSCLATALKNANVPYVEVTHHSGFQPDIFSMNEDWYLTSLYDGGIYAPAVTLNRSKLGSNSTPVFDPQGIATTTSCLQLANAECPYVSIALDAKYNPDTRIVNLRAEFYTHTQMPGTEHRYTLYLVQDSIIGNQANYGTNYIHNATSRGCITEGGWGEIAEFIPGKTLVVNKEFELPEAILSTYYAEQKGTEISIPTVLEHMKVVAFVHQHEGTSAYTQKVFNCAEVAIGDKMEQGGFVSSISTLSSPEVRNMPTRKYLRNGQVLISRGGHTYNVYGIEVK